jgi:hypothetical protein
MIFPLCSKKPVCVSPSHCDETSSNDAQKTAHYGFRYFVARLAYLSHYVVKNEQYTLA